MNVLVTGATGFLGKHMVEALSRRSDTRVLLFEIGHTNQMLEEHLIRADAICHLAGINRTQNPSEFKSGNVELTRLICDRLRVLGRTPIIVFSSSTQAALDNDYGRSKKEAENIIQQFANETGAAARIVRLQNVFGKWCRPNYNSVVATFCYNISHDLPIQISDRSKVLDLVYIDDVVETLLIMITENAVSGCEYREVAKSAPISLGVLADTLGSFREMRSNLLLFNLSDRLTRCLYATYLSYLSSDDFGYSLKKRSDSRGSLVEFVKSQYGGQVFVSRTRPGIIRGNHYHHTKVEKFFVIEGEAVIRFRSILSHEVIEYRVRGEDYRVLDIPPGYTHSIENVGPRELVTIFWASEVFNPDSPDTIALEVEHE